MSNYPLYPDIVVLFSNFHLFEKKNQGLMKSKYFGSVYDLTPNYFYLGTIFGYTITTLKQLK